jgi:hypothetical protein
MPSFITKLRHTILMMDSDDDNDNNRQIRRELVSQCERLHFVYHYFLLRQVGIMLAFTIPLAYSVATGVLQKYFCQRQILLY